MLSAGGGAGWVCDLCWVLGAGYTFSANGLVVDIYLYPKSWFGKIIFFEKSGT